MSKKVWIGVGIAIGISALTGVVIYTNKGDKDLEKIDLSKFDSPDIKGSGKCMDKDFLRLLLKLEKETGYPIFDWINSGARSEYWNKKVGGVKNSSHKIPTCKAADIKASNKTIRNNLVMAAKKVGFKRIGVGNTFVHVDNDESKSQYVAWGYGGKKPAINPFV